MAQKIKKAVPKKPTAKDMLSFIEAEKRDTPAREKAVSYKNTPSKRPEFKRWQGRREVENWNSSDFLGYYLNKFVEIIGEEDADFKRANTYKFTKEKQYLNQCLKTHFNEDKEKFKEYINFIVEWWMSEDSFVDGLPTIWSVFTSKKGTFVKKFIAEKLVPKKKGKRKDVDNQFAGKSAWDSYFEEGGE
jgi:hypothetical protein